MNALPLLSLLSTQKEENKPMPNSDAVTIKTFTDIPVPPPRSGSRASKYPWDSMAKDQSFFVPSGKSDTFNTLVSSRNKREKTMNGDKAKLYVARKYTHEGIEGVMVWRTA